MAVEKPNAEKSTSAAEVLGGLAIFVMSGPVIALVGGLWLGMLWRLATLAWGVWW